MAPKKAAEKAVAAPPLLKGTVATDPGVVKALNEIITEIWNKYLLFKEPQTVFFDEIVPDKSNRKGQKCNAPYVHGTICPNLKKDGYIDSRS